MKHQEKPVEPASEQDRTSEMNEMNGTMPDEMTDGRKQSGIRIMARLIGLVTPLLPFMLLAVLTGVVGYLCAIFLTVLAGGGVLLAQELPLPRLFPQTPESLFGCLLLIAVLRGVLHYFEQQCNHYIAFKLLAIIRHRVFAALRRLCPAKLDGKDRGGLVSVITSDIELLEVFYAHTISPIAIAALTSLLMLLFLGSFDLRCALLAACGYASVGIVLPLWNAKHGAAAGMAYRERFAQMNGFLLDSLRGLRETQQYGGEAARLTALSEGSDRLSAQQRALSRREGRTTAATGVCISVFSFAMLFLGLWLCGQPGRFEFSSVVLTTLAMMGSFGPVTALSNLSNNLLQTLACGERVLDLLEEEPVVSEVAGQPHTAFQSAALSDVCFSYHRDSERVLDGVSMDFSEGKIFGIHGKSGSGKSTILKLLMRFWDADSGKVLISERDIRTVNTADLRNAESFVTQETVLFHDTIAKNIAVGKVGATREEIVAAAKKASVHSFICSLPNGYDTEVGELGDTLSGGERQRIGVARAFLHDAPFLLLDEPTSNLDVLNEAIILRSLREEQKSRTVVLVSHRSSTMGICDKVCEMQKGRVS